MSSERPGQPVGSGVGPQGRQLWGRAVAPRRLVAEGLRVPPPVSLQTPRSHSLKARRLLPVYRH